MTFERTFVPPSFPGSSEILRRRPSFLMRRTFHTPVACCSISPPFRFSLCSTFSFPRERRRLFCRRCPLGVPVDRIRQGEKFHLRVSYIETRRQKSSMVLSFQRGRGSLRIAAVPFWCVKSDEEIINGINKLSGSADDGGWRVLFPFHRGRAHSSSLLRSPPSQANLLS